MLTDIAVVVAPPVAAFELGVLAEVFGVDRTADGLPGYDFAVAAEEPGRVSTTSGFAVEAIYALDRLSSADLLAIPSWPRELEPSAALVAALHDAVRRGARLLAVCSGAFLVAAAGLLDGRRAATHWRYAAQLAERYPGVTVDASVLYVIDGPVVTSAGTAAAIDACLHLVRTEHGSATANRVARAMVVAPHREGGQAQFVESPVADARHPGLGPVLDRAMCNLDQKLTVNQLAGWANISPRTFVRRFNAATGTTPHSWLLEQRLLRAEHLLETTHLTVPVVAARSGIGSADNLRHHLKRRRGISPSTYRCIFGHSQP